MENTPKKSKALIITIIIIMIIVGSIYLIIKNRDSFGEKTSSNITRIFSPLIPSENRDQIEVQAGEDIKSGDSVSAFGVNTDNKTIVVKTKDGGVVLGYAEKDIKSGDIGKIKKSNRNNFWDSFFSFINIKSKTNDVCSNGATNYPECDNKNWDGDIDNKYEGDDGDGDDGDNGYGDGDDFDNEGKDTYKYPSVTVKAEPQTVSKGESSTISWTSTNAKECDAGEYSTSKGVSGSFETDKLTSSKSYTIKCKGENGTSSGNAFVFVNSENKEFPDVTVSRVSPIVATVNENTTISSIVTNIGKDTTQNTFSGFFTISNKDETLKKEVVTTIPVLPISTGNVATTYYNFPSTGIYYLRFCADKSNLSDEGKISESNENNNCSAVTTLTATSAIPTNFCPNGATNYPECNNGINFCPNGATNYPECNNGGDDDEDDSDEEGEENKCKILEENPLIFTAAEKAKLAQLLRKYYLISPTLKSETDIDLIYSDMDELSSQIDVITDVTRQCYLLTNDPAGYNDFKSRNPKLALPAFESSTSPKPNYSYTGPKTKGGNPWFKPEVRVSYLDPKLSNGQKVISERPYCSGIYDPADIKETVWWKKILDVISPIAAFGNLWENLSIKNSNQTCSGLNAKSRMTCENGSDGSKMFTTGCTWTGLSGVGDWNGINDDYENLLNVW